MPLSSSASRSTRGAFHQQVLPATARAELGARHRFPGQGRGIGFRRHALPARAEKAERRLSTSAITAVLQHNCGQIVHPAHRERSCLLCLVLRAALHLTVQDWPSCLGPGAAESSWPSPASPRAMTRRGALPRADRLGHLLSRNRACAGRRIRTQEKEQVPANPPPDGAQGAVRMRAAASAPPRRGDVGSMPEVPSIDRQPRGPTQ